MWSLGVKLGVWLLFERDVETPVREYRGQARLGLSGLSDVISRDCFSNQLTRLFLE